MYVFINRITALRTNGDSNVLVCGTDTNQIECRAIWNLQIYYTIALSDVVGGISSLFFTEGKHLLCFFCIC
jgi:hypothetical protein